MADNPRVHFANLQAKAVQAKAVLDAAYALNDDPEHREKVDEFIDLARSLIGLVDNGLDVSVIGKWVLD